MPWVEGAGGGHAHALAAMRMLRARSGGLCMRMPWVEGAGGVHARAACTAARITKIAKIAKPQNI